MSRHTKVKATTILFIAIAISFAIYSFLNPLDSSSNVGEFYSSNPDAGPDAELWGRGGSYFRWQSNQAENSQLPELNIFYRTFGNIANPAIVMIHGWPTSSYDFKMVRGTVYLIEHPRMRWS